MIAFTIPATGLWVWDDGMRNCPFYLTQETHNLSSHPVTHQPQEATFHTHALTRTLHNPLPPILSGFTRKRGSGAGTGHSRSSWVLVLAMVIILAVSLWGPGAAAAHSWSRPSHARQLTFWTSSWAPPVPPSIPPTPRLRLPCRLPFSSLLHLTVPFHGHDHQHAHHSSIRLAFSHISLTHCTAASCITSINEILFYSRPPPSHSLPPPHDPRECLNSYPCCLFLISIHLLSEYEYKCFINAHSHG
ncbi:hypothetical protein BDZ97DRAFT_1024043 [Flammula alnicola]|nr:hypothetical protein BDZ97DRAFT_1024043 [Flammula alnicola]